MFITNTGNPGCRHIISYLYEIKFKKGIIPKPGNNDTFTLITQKNVLIALANGDFVANRAIMWLAYFIKRGVLTPENELNYIEICQHLQKKHNKFIIKEL